MLTTSERIGISAVVPVTERFDDVEALYRAYKSGVAATGETFEFIYVLDGEFPEVHATLRALREQGEPIKIVGLAKWFGEATALTIGFEQAAGEVILTLPAYQQVRADEIPRLFEALEGCEMVVARRFPRRDSKLNVAQSKAFHFLLRSMGEVPFQDLGCGLRLFRRQVAEELNIYGDQHRFIPILARQQGFKVVEVDAAQAEDDVFRRVYSLGVYIRRMLDMLSVVFITKFTKKPLRFFGLIGSFVLLIGTLSTLYLVVDRLFFGVALADRPALVLAVLMIVLGFQMIAVGLIGELIIFTHAKDLKEYKVKRVVE